jgi:hypothetical protein
MKRTRRLVASASLVFAFLAADTGHALAAADNAAVAINTHDDSYVYKGALKVTRVNKDTVDQVNAAWASSSCERCRTAAVAVQIVLVTRDAGTVTPTNLAAAVNQNCTTCATYAGAWQYVVTTGTPVHFTDAGSARIDAIRGQLGDLLASATFGPDAAEIDAFNTQVDTLVSQLEDVLNNEIVRSGGGSITEHEIADRAA